MGRDDLQLDLFGEARSRPTSRRTVGRAPVEEDLEGIAGRLPAELRLGTSSWSFPGWEGIVYDRAASKAHLARNGLAAYARHPLLRTVGIDRTYYGPISAGEFARYAEAVPDGFRFLVKAPQACTSPWHRGFEGAEEGPNEHFLDASYARDEAVGPYMEGLGPKAGLLLFQFPPLGAALTRDPERFAARLAVFLMALPSGPRYAVELRDEALLGDPYGEALAEVSASHCYNVHPRMPSIREQVGRLSNASPTTVVRWMLHGGLAYEEALQRYEPFDELVDEDPASREEIAELCLHSERQRRSTFVVANNKAEGSAPLSVFKLASLVARQPRTPPRSARPVDPHVPDRSSSVRRG